MSASQTDPGGDAITADMPTEIKAPPLLERRLAVRIRSAMRFFPDAVFPGPAPNGIARIRRMRMLVGLAIPLLWLALACADGLREDALVL